MARFLAKPGFKDGDFAVDQNDFMHLSTIVI
jgi:hypothetical protein